MRLRIREMETAARSGTLFYERFSASIDGYCDVCGKHGQLYLVAIIKADEDVGGHLQNAGRIWAVGPHCFNRISKLVENKIKPFVSI